MVVTAGMTADSTLFHLWGAKDALSFLVVAATVGPDANITVDWAALRNGSAGSITFPSKPSHVFGFVIPSVSLGGFKILILPLSYHTHTYIFFLYFSLSACKVLY